jgi:hypothetical protein
VNLNALRTVSRAKMRRNYANTRAWAEGLKALSWYSKTPKIALVFLKLKEEYERKSEETIYHSRYIEDQLASKHSVERDGTRRRHEGIQLQ